MSDFWKDTTGLLAMVVGVAMVTTLILPGRQTPAVLKAGLGGFSQVLATAMGGSGIGVGSSAIGFS